MAVQAPPSIQVDYSPRIEGEGGLDVVVSGPEITRLRLRVFEPPRHPQAAAVGRHIEEVPEAVSRICGTCPVAHHLGATQAIEDALGIEPSPQTRALRRILTFAQWIQCHSLHIHLLAAPGLLGYRSTCALASAHPEVVQRALRLKKLGAELTAAIGGRRMTPLAAQINGFSPLPIPAALERLHARLTRARTDAIDTMALVSGLVLPSFTRAAEHAALRHPEAYPAGEGRVVSTQGLDADAREYRGHALATRRGTGDGGRATGDRRPETQRPDLREAGLPSPVPGQSDGRLETQQADPGRQAGLPSPVPGQRGGFLVGPLARVNLNRDRLCHAAAQAVQSCSVVFPTFNPFASVVARAVELIQAVEECTRILERLDLAPEGNGFAVRAGEGASVTEAPRGLLYHRYAVDPDGRVRAAEILAPSAMNLWCVEEDLRALVPQVLHLPEEDRRLRLEMLVRSYDLCGACCAEIPVETMPSAGGQKG